MTGLTLTTGCPDDSKGKSDQGDGGGAGTGTEPEDLMGSYVIDGVTHDCRVSTQIFEPTKEFSVVCQKDDEGLVQITFKDEASARKVQDFQITSRDIFKHPDPLTIDVGYQPFATGAKVIDSSDESTGTASVTAVGSHHAITLSAVTLENVDGTTTGTVSATVNF